MDEIDKLIQGVGLPITLPPGTIFVMGKRRIPNFDVILAQLPKELAAHVNLNATAPGGGPEHYLLPLRDGRYLKISLTETELVALAVVGG
jgi:hypothetical protein